MKRIKLLLILLSVFFTLFGCKVSEPAVEYREIVRDSIIYVTDTISVQIPFEVVKETIPVIDTSIIKTSYAESVAYIDTTNRSLFHSLEQRGKVEVPIDTLLVVEYVDREVEKEIIKEVEVPKYDNLFYFLMVYFIISLLMIISSAVNKKD